MCGAKIHRIFVVDGATGKLLRVASLRDIIAKFVCEPTPDYFGNYFWYAAWGQPRRRTAHPLARPLFLPPRSEGFSLNSKLGV